LIIKEIERIADELRELLRKDLPGEKAHNKMIPETRKSFPKGPVKREAAVLIILFPDKKNIKISLIKRTEYEGAHSGQISFPGGMKESIDINLKMTALREASEETGIGKSELIVLGKLTPINIPVSAFRVQPYVAYCRKTPSFSPDPVEVEYMINIPVQHLLEVSNRKKEKWNLGNIEAEVPFYSYSTFKIWGATAMIMSEFLDIIAAIEPDLWTIQYFDNDCSDT
jgi:8-oxo-dGTP pyrophosphatase MutT (NUDIX family)